MLDDDRRRCRLLVACNRLAVDIDNEIAVVHTFLRDKVRHKFPELESLVSAPLGGMMMRGLLRGGRVGPRRQRHLE